MDGIAMSYTQMSYSVTLIYTIGQVAITQVQRDGGCQVSRGSCGKEDIITAIFGKRNLLQPFTMVSELLHKS